MGRLCFGSLILFLSACSSLVTRSWPAVSRWFGGMGSALGCILMLIPALDVLMSGTALTLELPWSVPGSAGLLELDPLSALFSVPLLVVSALASLYGTGYLKPEDCHVRHHWSWPLFSVLVASMLLVLMARDGFVFLLAWELMTLSSFGLVVFDHEDTKAQSAGIIYLIAGHLGLVCIIALFMILSDGSPDLAFSSFRTSGSPTLLFVLALLGFGTKAGFLPLHVWLPPAHSSAPSHVSAVMSGVMIKMGIYGLIRTLSFLGEPRWEWGMTLVVVGAISGMGGVLFALAQHDIKRLLAYHSVENIGIITLGIGLGVTGQALGMPAMALLGWSGGLLHVINHAIFKSLLFMGAGAIANSTGTRNMELLGGLARRIPVVSWCFLVGAVAISGIPPFNGFVSEFLVYSSSWQAIGSQSTETLLPASLTILSLALIGGLALACFSKVFGIVFLGEPRTERAANAKTSVHVTMVAAMVLLAGLCLLIGVAAPQVINIIVASKAVPATSGDWSNSAVNALFWVSVSSTAIIILVAALWLLRRQCGRSQSQHVAPTWDCGYEQPSARMQYTASSFAQPVTTAFSWWLRTTENRKTASGYFPAHGNFSSHTHDSFLEHLFKPVFRWVGWTIGLVRIMQKGRVQVYLLYILLTLIILLFIQAGQ